MINNLYIVLCSSLHDCYEYDDSRERVESALKLESLDRPPAAIFTSCDTIGMQKRSGAFWPEAHKDPKIMAKLGCAEADYFGLEAVRAGFCLTEEAEALGCTVDISKTDAAPMIKSHLYKFNPTDGIFDEPDLLSPEEMVSTGRVKTTVDAIKLMAKSHGEEYMIIAGMTGPFTLTGHLLNTENMVFGLMMYPDVVKKWVTAVTPLSFAFGQALSDAGADVLQMSEPSGSTDMIEPDQFDAVSGNFVRKCLTDVKDAYKVLHICGDTAPILRHMMLTGVTGLSIEEKVDPKDAVRIVEEESCLVGNVGCVFPLMQGKPQDVADAAVKSADAGFNIISAGCGVPLKTPDENIEAFVKAVKEYKGWTKPPTRM